jgi:hypothetical protein
MVNNANELSFHLYPNPPSNMQQSKKIGPFMNIMCVTSNKAIFYFILLSTGLGVFLLSFWLRILTFGSIEICFP